MADGSSTDYNTVPTPKLKVRAKFKCISASMTRYGLQFSNQVEYTFSAVCADEVEENQRFHKYTPSGSLKIMVDNPLVSYEPGKSYYLDFSPAD